MSLKNLEEFVHRQRNRFAIRENNLFAKSFGEITRYFLFLTIIKERHDKLVKEYSGIFSQFQETIDKTPGSHRATDKQIVLDREMTKLGNQIQLEIESFYQFAKILLDKAATAIEYYFGKDKDVEIYRHRGLIEKKGNSNLLKIQLYAVNKQLVLDKKLLDKMIDIQKEISDFRDSYITHLQSPRTIRGTSVDGRMLISKIYPKGETESEQVVSASFSELLVLVRQYVDLLVVFLENNNDKASLSLAS